MPKNTPKNDHPETSLPLFVVNPRSASGATRSNWTSTAADIRAHFGPFAVAFTKHQGDAIDIAERSALAGRRFIIACGGDGTINEVANGILRSGKDVELGILPSGTGGDFRRTLGISAGNREAAVELRTGDTKRIDVGKVTFQDFQGKAASRFFLNVSSFGLASSIIKRVKSATVFDWLPVESLRGRANFAFSTLQEVIDLDPLNIRVRLDGGEERTVQTINFCVANARYFGGGMMIAPDAKLTDGHFDVVNIGDIGTAKILINAHTLYRGTHHQLKEVHATLARRIDVSATDPRREIRIETDGELPGTLPATYEIVPSALRIRVPRTT
ncbi:MAG: diacylglycerol kinase family protein [Acidobacteriota bacterium]